MGRLWKEAYGAMQEHLVGYDARVPEMSVPGFWDAPRRAGFLLREDVRAPLSIDAMVWPSLFDWGQGIGLPAEERRALGLAGLDPYSPHDVFRWVGPNAPLWEDLGALQTRLRSAGPDAGNWTTVAVTLVQGLDALAAERDRDERAGGGFSHAPAPLQGQLDSRWQRLGYDVADGSFISGLSNCGYTEDEASVLRLAWASRLNEHHLFDDPSEALAFRPLTDDRVPEHAPFYVYGIYSREEPL